MSRKQKKSGFGAGLRDSLLLRVKELYGVEAEHPFRTSPDAVVFRHADNRKWFGIVMTVREKALGGAAMPLPAGDRFIDILNVKLDPMLVAELRTQRGFHPAYHMNHTSWLTIRLDGSVAMEEIEPLLDMSFALTARDGAAGGGRCRPSGGADPDRASLQGPGCPSASV